MKPKKHKTTHEETLAALARIEGQARGLQQMVKDGRYCIDIVTQLHAAQRALCSVSERILAKHIQHCVVDAFSSKSNKEKKQKINELMTVIKRLHRL